MSQVAVRPALCLRAVWFGGRELTDPSFEDGAESDDEDEPDNSRARNQKARRDRIAERESKKQKLVKDIQSAAGGPLTGSLDP